MFLLRLLFAVLLLFPLTYCNGSNNNTIVARVNSSNISVDELTARLREYQANLKGDSSHEAQIFRKRVLNELIEERVLLTEAEKRKISIQPAELNAALHKVEKDYEGHSFEKVLSDKKMTYARWRERMRRKLILDKVVAEITKDVPPPSKKAIAAYYKEHQSDYQRPEQVRVAQIVVKTEEDGKRILEELKKGKSFDELAQTYSFTPEANQGGDLGFVEKGVMPTLLEKAFWKLRVGQTTPIIQTDYGYHVVRVLERRPKHIVSLKEAQPQILRVLTQQDREQTFSTWRREVLSRAKIERNHALLETID